MYFLSWQGGLLLNIAAASFLTVCFLKYFFLCIGLNLKIMQGRELFLHQLRTNGPSTKRGDSIHKRWKKAKAN